MKRPLADSRSILPPVEGDLGDDAHKLDQASQPTCQETRQLPIYRHRPASTKSRLYAVKCVVSRHRRGRLARRTVERCLD